MLHDCINMILQTSFTMQTSFMLVLFIIVLPCEDTPETKGDILYTYNKRKEAERRRDTETNIERGKGLHHMLATM